jgi:hypothetical protein
LSVVLLALAGLLAIAAIVAWRGQSAWPLSGFGWKGTEKAGWIAGILGAVLALASFVFDRLDASRERMPSAPQADRLVQVGRVPQQASWFQDRRTGVELARVAKAGRTAVPTQVLSGMGGVGKTQLAAQFARRLASSGELDVLVWVNASSRDAIVAAYAEAARAVKVAEPDVGRKAAAGRMLGWLERTDQRWLIVLDNLDSPAHAGGWWPPNTANGRTVATTRRRDAVLQSDARTVVTVDLFTPDEAVDYLTRAIGKPAARADLKPLAEDLGYLPLAVAQAAAFIRDRGWDCTRYRERLADRRHRLAELLPHRDALPDDHRATVAATWSLSIAAADDTAPRGLARPTLTIAAVLDPNTIPIGLFITAPARTYLNRQRDADAGPVDEGAVHDALHNLHRLTLITRDDDTRSIRVHALVQRASRDNLSVEQLTTAAQAAADALLAIWPDIERNPGYGQILRANATALYHNTGKTLLAGGVHPVLMRNAESRGESGDPAGAIIAYDDLLTDCLTTFGPRHADTLGIRSHLINWRGEAGDAAGAATAYEQLLTDYTAALGPNHLDTLTARRYYARWRGEAGDAAGAATALEQLLTDGLRILDRDHFEVFGTGVELARWRGEAGDAAGAATALEQLLQDCLRFFGPDHPNALITRDYLANWRGEAGDAAGAVTAYEQLFTDSLKVLGPEHPDTLSTRDFLARWRGKAGDPVGAVTAYEQLLTDCLRVLGPEHPQTMTARKHLANWIAQAPTAAKTASSE